MKNQWLIWAFFIGIVVIVLFAFNNQGQDMVSLTDIFPESEMTQEPEIEYEFVDQEAPQAIEQVVEMPMESSTVPAGQTMAQPQSVAAVSSRSAETAPSVAVDVPVSDFSAVPYTIQVLSFRDKAKAQKALADVKAAGHPGYIATADLGEKGTWHRIYIGRFTTRSEAESFLSKVQKIYKGSFIISPKK